MKILIYGLGHIGGSIALGIKKHSSTNHKLSFVDSDKKTLAMAHKKKLTNGFLPSDKRCTKEIESSDIIFICVSPSNIPQVLKKIRNCKTKQTLIVTDVASTKKDTISNARKTFKNQVSFVGGHPIAGTEKSGFENADPNLFKNRIFVQSGLIGKKSNKSKIMKIWKELGSKTIEVTPSEHDKVFSYLSHLPHALSFCLNKVATKALGKNKIEMLGGSSYKDYSRISSSSENLWADIFLSNQKNLITSINSSIVFLNKLKSALRQKSDKKVSKLIK